MSSLTILLIGSVIWWVYQVGLNGGFTKMVDNMSDGIAETNAKTEELVSAADIRALLEASGKIKPTVKPDEDIERYEHRDCDMSYSY